MREEVRDEVVVSVSLVNDGKVRSREKGASRSKSCDDKETCTIVPRYEEVEDENARKSNSDDSSDGAEQENALGGSSCMTRREMRGRSLKSRRAQ